MKLKATCIAWYLLSAAVAYAGAPSFAPCAADPKTQGQRSKELQDLYNADQDDYRKELEAHPDRPIDPAKLMLMAEKDLTRRKRVGEIFAEGCFHSAEDYAAAAMIYQHGDTADHSFQAFIWAKEAVDLGDRKEKAVMEIGIDRFLIRSGHQQLFGSQANKPSGATACWCLEPIETSFPDSLRKDYHGRNLDDAISWLRSLNGANHCPDIYCKDDLKPSPRGTVPGFW